MSGFGGPSTGDICYVCMCAPMPYDTEFGDRLPSETPDFTGGLRGTTGIPLSGFIRPITSDIHSLHVGSLIPDDTKV